MELYIKWPVLLHNSVQLSLIASGMIVRIEPGRAEMAIGRYEFRTCVPQFFERFQPGQLAGRGAPEWPQPEVTDECTLLERRPGRRAKGEVDDALWERVFQEKFADPEYYSFRWLSHSSPKAGV